MAAVSGPSREAWKLITQSRLAEELLLSKQNLHLGRYAIPFAAFFEAQTAVERRSSGIRELQSLHEGKWCHDCALGKRHIELRLAQSNFRCYLEVWGVLKKA